MRRLPCFVLIAVMLFGATGTSAETAEPSSAAASATALATLTSSIDGGPVRRSVSAVSVPGETGKTRDSKEVARAEQRMPSDDGLLVSGSFLAAAAERMDGSASARAYAEEVSLFEQPNGMPLITFRQARAAATAECDPAGKSSTDSQGSVLVGLTVGETTFERTPEPNTVLQLGYEGDATTTDDNMTVTVVLNEQRAASPGDGLSVTMVHVIATAPDDPDVVYAELALAFAEVSVFCGDAGDAGGGSSGTEDGITITSTVVTTDSDPEGATDGSEATAAPDESVTWELAITNDGETAAALASISFVQPSGFGLEETSGDLSEDQEPTAEDGVVTWDAQIDLAPGEAVTEQIVSRAPADAEPGTYLVDASATTGETRFAQGLSGPVELQDAGSDVATGGPGDDATTPANEAGVEAAPSHGDGAASGAPGALPLTGVPARPVIALVLLLAAGAACLGLRRADASMLLSGNTTAGPRRSPTGE